MTARPCCRVDTDDGYVIVESGYYEDLKDRLDRKEEGGIELRLVEHPSGLAWLRLERITLLSLYPSAWHAVKEADEREAKLREMRGEDE